MLDCVLKPDTAALWEKTQLRGLRRDSCLAVSLTATWVIYVKVQTPHGS